MKTVIEMAREAGLDWQRGWTLDDDDDEPNRFEAFAALVAAQEREAIAQMFDNQNIWDEEVAIAIRARGTT